MERKWLNHNKIKFYGILIWKWVSIASLVGMTGGIVGSLFAIGVEKADEIWFANKWLIYILPISGLIIIFLYHLFKFKKAKGTNRVIDKIRDEDELPVVVGPLIFVSSVITHLFGGSAGREGAAVQIGGSIGSGFAKYFDKDPKDTALIVIAGAAAVFSALFGTPITSVFFALESISVGTIYYAGLVPCLISSIIAFGVSKAMGVTGFNVGFVRIPNLDFPNIIQVAVIGVAAALLSVIIVIAFTKTRDILENTIHNAYARVVMGGIAIIALSFVFNDGAYNGSGMSVIIDALHGNVVPWAFLVKLLFTAITLGAGFKGGDIVPVFFIGSTMGAALGSLIGMDPGFAAALGLIATFCGCVNSPVASIILSVELFGGGGIVYFAIACALAYSFSGYYSLYSSQKIIYSKTKAEFVDARTR